MWHLALFQVSLFQVGTIASFTLLIFDMKELAVLHAAHHFIYHLIHAA